MQQINPPSRQTGMSYVPRSYPVFDAGWYATFAVVALVIWLINPVVGAIFVLICSPFLVYRMACFWIDFGGAWADRKWGYKLWLEDCMETPCSLHMHSTEDVSCPYLHADQSDITVYT